MQTLQASNIDLRVLINIFGLKFVQDVEFFPESHEPLPIMTELERQ